MSRLTDGLDGPNARRSWRNPERLEHRRECKLMVQRARCESGTTYKLMAASTGRSINTVWDIMNVNDDRRMLTYADLVAMAQHTMTRTFVAHLLKPIEQALRGPDGRDR